MYIKFSLAIRLQLASLGNSSLFLLLNYAKENLLPSEDVYLPFQLLDGLQNGRQLAVKLPQFFFFKVKLSKEKMETF